jgi:pyruvate,orthophosphate dikinase
MTYVYNFDEPPAAPEEDSLHLLGGKGHNLTVMRRDLGLPVPPGFTITTEAGRVYMSGGWPDDLDYQLRHQMARIEEEVGRQFGDGGEPLLVSVRSGAAVSMPGMMDTILNLGLSEHTQAALAAACGDPDFASESRQRLEKMYCEIVGVDRVPDDPWEQLRGAIRAVFESWNTPRARAYREREGISHDLGTAVTVQAMVFGNLDENSGTGVLFTRNPATGEPTPYGDVLFRAQGEDVVAGTHSTESIEQLGRHLPQVAQELRNHADTLERHFRDVCDIEFTIERATLWLLQVRVGKRSPQAALRFAVDMAEEDDFPLTREEAIERVARYLADPPVSVTQVRPDVEPLATGLPASPGIASGRIATTADSAVSMADEGSDVILVRPETSPHDVHGMARAKGILTSRGGLASHAAVVARGWGTPAVVGAETVEVKDGKVVMAGRTFGEGDVITINGATGEIFVGVIETEMVVSPAGQRLLGWAEELEIDIASLLEPNQTETSAVGDEDRDVSPEDVIRALHIKGFLTAEGLAPVVMSSQANVERVLETLESDGVIKQMGGMYQLTPVGREQGESLMSRDRREWSEGNANHALDGFLAFDARMKEVVTAWQMREVDGEQELNDHSDEEYDQAVLEDFYDLHDDARAWLEPLTGELGRLRIYLARLDRAAAAVRSGDHAHIASPRIDSYHNVWFELHEDLIQLAGRTREQETEAGRA